MKHPRSKDKRVLCGLLLGILAAPCLSTWRAWRQATLNRDLIVAIKKNDPPLVIGLLHQGADANSRDLSEENDSLWQKIWERLHGKPWIQRDLPPALVVAMEAYPPGYASIENKSILKELVKAGANVNSHSQGNITLLDRAVCNHDIDMATLYLTHGANPNDGGNSNNGTPLTDAILINEPGSEQMAQLLLSYGADPNSRDMAHRGGGSNFAGECDFSRQTALICVITNLAERSSPSEMKLIKALIAHGADVNGVDDNGRTALMWAIGGNSKADAIVAYLLDKGASVSCKDKLGLTPLHLAYLRQQSSEGRGKCPYGADDATFIIHLLKKEAKD